MTPAQRFLHEKHQTCAAHVGITIWYVCVDVLHVLDLGVCQHVCASVLYMMAFDAGIEGNRVEERLATLWKYVGEAYG